MNVADKPIGLLDVASPVRYSADGHVIAPVTAPNLEQRILEVQTSVNYIQKLGNNTFHKYKYAMESDILPVVKGACNKAGLIITSKIIDSSNGQLPDGKRYATVMMEFRVTDVESGEFIESAFPGYAEDTGDKAIYKAMTGANKYFHMKFFGIATGDDPEKDENNNSPVNPNHDQYLRHVGSTNLRPPHEQDSYPADKLAAINQFRALRDHLGLSMEQGNQVAGKRMSTRLSLDEVNEGLVKLREFETRCHLMNLTPEDEAIIAMGHEESKIPPL